MTINGIDYTQIYGMNDDSDSEIAEWTKKIYNFEGINYEPHEVILLTDGTCGSTCACFTKHIV